MYSTIISMLCVFILLYNQPSILFATVSVPLRGSLGQPCSHLLAPKGPTLNSVTSDSSLISSPALQPLILEEIFPYPSNG